MRIVADLSHAEATLATHAIQCELQRRGKTAVIAVADAQGELVALQRLDDTPPPLPSILIAANKAWTAAREGKPTRTWGKLHAIPNTALIWRTSGINEKRYIGWGGRHPRPCCWTGSRCSRVSRLPELEDMELADIGVRAIGERLSSDSGSSESRRPAHNARC
jgi:glc operon protein GlcG